MLRAREKSARHPPGDPVLRFDRYAPRLEATHAELRRCHTDMTAYSYWTALSAMIRRGVDPDDSPAVERYAKGLTAMNLCRLRAALRVWVRDDRGEIPSHWRWLTARARTPARTGSPKVTVAEAGTTDDLPAFTEALIAAGAAPHGALGYSRDVGAVLRACAREGLTPDQVVHARSPSYGYRLACAWKAWIRWRASRGLATLPVSVHTRDTPTEAAPAPRKASPAPAALRERLEEPSEALTPGLGTCEASRALLEHLTRALGWPLSRCLALRWSGCVVLEDAEGRIVSLTAPKTGTASDWSSSGRLAKKLSPLADPHWCRVLWAHRAWTAPPHEDAPLFPVASRSVEPLTEPVARLVLAGTVPTDPWGADDLPREATAPAREESPPDPIAVAPRLDRGEAHAITSRLLFAALDDGEEVR